MIRSLFFLPLFILLTGCPAKNKEGAESGERRAIDVSDNQICFSKQKNDVLSRYVLSMNKKGYSVLLVGDFKHLIYPETCVKSHLEKGITYAASYTLNDKNYYYTFILDDNGRVRDPTKM